MFMAAGDDTPFVDSNIWLYALVEGDDPVKTELARRVVQGSCLLSTQVVNEICVNLLRKAGRTEDEIAELIRCLHRQHAVTLVDEEVLLQAVDLRRAYSLSYWDSLIASAALVAGATHLFTEDMQDGLWIKGRLQIVNPLLVR
jgi:predicted nucleic acid-binding protein